jgi:hypothetical protein
MTVDMPSIPLAALVLVGIGSPASLLALLGVASLLNRPLPERWTGPLAGSSMTIACGAFATALLVYGMAGTGTTLLSYGVWSTSHEGGIAIEFLVDRLALSFAVLSTAIAGVVSAFSSRYLHRERGYNRYFVLLAIFVTGMLMVALAGNVAVLFIGWELVGLSSALLVAFFQERPAAVSNAFRVVSVYRISDAAMLSAAVLLRHVAGSDSLSLLFGGAAANADLSGTNTTIIAILLVVAVAGKSALLPFSSWLPRAMEGPTPSSAVYYGSLSIHAGCFLLLRAAPLLEQAPAEQPPRRRARRGYSAVCGNDDTSTKRREVAAGICLAHAGRDHRHRNCPWLVHTRVHPSGRTCVLSPAAIPERAERSPRPARTRGLDRRSHEWRCQCRPGPRAIGSRTTGVSDRARTGVPRHRPRSVRGRAVYETGRCPDPS